MRFIIRVSVIVWLFLASQFSSGDTPKMKWTPKHQDIYWQSYAIDVASALGCYATFETLNDLPRNGSRFENVEIKDDEEIKTAKELTSKLEHACPGLSVAANKRNAKILHIIDTKLSTIKDYSLEQRIDVKYEGIASELAFTIRTRLPGFGPMDFGVLGTEFDDNVTLVHIDATRETVRDILTNCIPLQKYGAALWRAQTFLDGENPLRTKVQFYGPVNPSSAEPMPK